MDDLELRATIKDELSRGLGNIRQELRSTGREAEQAGSRANIGSRGFDRMVSSAGKVGLVAGGVMVRGLGLGAAAAGGMAGAVIGLGVSTAAGMEQSSIAFTTMLGSAKKAKDFIAKLADFAARTPFDFPGLQDAASQLVSAGVDVDKVIPIMTTLGDVTAGMGTGAEGVQRATYAIQQMIAAGKIQGEDLNQLRDAGIPVYDLLSKALGKTKAEVVDLLGKGKLGGEALTKMMHALETGKGLERFSGLMNKQSQSLSGQWSTLQDNVKMGLAGAVMPLMPVLNNVLGASSNFATKAIPHIRSGIKTAVREGRALKGAFDKHGIDGLAKELQKRYGVDAPKALGILKGIVHDVSDVFTGSLVPALDDASGAVPLLLSPLGILRGVLGFAADHTTTTRVALEGLVIALTVAKGVTGAYAAIQGVLAAKEAVSLFMLKAHTAGTVEYAVVSRVVAGAQKVWAAAQWALNAAMSANPIGIVIVLVSALVLGVIYAYKHFKWFRTGVQAAFHAVAAAGKWMWNNVLQPVFSFLVGAVGHVLHMWAKMLGILAHVPGFGWAKTASRLLGGAGDKALELAGKIHKIPDSKKVKVTADTMPANASVNALEHNINHATRPRTIRVSVQQGGASINAGGMIGTLGDTRTSQARGRGGLGNTLAFHDRTTALTGARPKITNVFMGGGGRGRGSGDHQAGRALDLTGPGLGSYAQATRDAGGYAAFHGDGASRHLHVVPPAQASAAVGDTASTQARSRPVHPEHAAGGVIVLERGAVEVINPTSNVDVTKAVKDGIESWMRDHRERS